MIGAGRQLQFVAIVYLNKDSLPDPSVASDDVHILLQEPENSGVFLIRRRVGE